MPAIRNPSRNLLFQALPDYMQGRARALSLVLVLPLGILTAGVLLRLLHLERQPWMLPATGVLATIAYWFFSAKTNRAYLGAVLSTMAEKLYIPREHMGELDRERDRELYEALARGVSHENEQISVTYAKALVQAFPVDAWRIVLERLRGAGSRTRDQLIRLIVPRMPAGEKGVLYDYLESSDSHQQATILDILFEAKDAPAHAHVAACLKSDNPRLAASGIFGVYCYDDPALRDQAWARWTELLHSERSPFLLAGLDLLRRRPDAAMFDAAARLLQHADARVRRATLIALERFSSVDSGTFAPLLRPLLRDREHSVRIAAVGCTRLLALPECQKHCLDALEDRHPQVVRTALEVLGNLYAKDFVEMALTWLEGNSGSPRAQRALIELILRQPVPSARLAGFVRSKVGEALTLAHALRLVEKSRAAPPDTMRLELLALALREKLDRVIALSLTALEGIEDRQLVRTVRAGLASKDPRQEARALEALEDLGARDIAASLRVIFGRGGNRDRVSGSAGPSFSTLGEVIEHFRNSRDAWLRDCAAFARPGEIAAAA